MQFTPPATRWCHVTCRTVKHHKFFNIAALTRFCERALVEEFERRGWPCEVALLPDRFHLLVEVPADVSREQLIRTVNMSAAAASRTAAAGRATRVWEDHCWCSVVTNGAAIEAIRRRLRALNTRGATSPL
jgi:hypothetical protein